MVEIALFQPDIAPNAATIIRMGACLGLRTRIIEPAGFIWSDSSFRRAGMDYLELADVIRHSSWKDFLASTTGRRRILLTTKAHQAYTAVNYQEDDILLLGRETVGVPDYVHDTVDDRVTIPMQPGRRSLNVAMACAIVAGEALRQTNQLPSLSCDAQLRE
jgi:tRNA (cytidine/uridine-2'-O-)-methyltransferase